MVRCSLLTAVGVSLGLCLLGGRASADDLWPSDRLVAPPKPAAAARAADLPESIVPCALAADPLPAPPPRVPVPAATLSEPTQFHEPEATFSGCAEPAAYPALPHCKLSIGPYGWLPETYGRAGIGRLNTDVAISTRDMLNLIEHNTHFLFAAQAELEYGRWAISAEGMYLYGGFGTAIRRFSFSGNFSQAIVDGYLSYELPGVASALGLPPGSEVEVLAGGRYWLLGGQVTLTGPFGRSATRGRDVDWVDPIVGGRLTYVLNDSTRVRVRGDVGGFGWWDASEDTWNVEAVVEKKCGNYMTLGAGYRILDVDYERGSGRDRFAFDVQMRGPVATLSIDF